MQSSRPLRIMMIHGLWESGTTFHIKTQAMERALQSSCPGGVELFYPTGHIRLEDPPYDPEGLLDAETKANPVSYTWFRTNENRTPFVYEGLDEGLAVIAKELRENGPFDGVIGFSQGGFLAGITASLLETGRCDVFDKYVKQMNGDAHEYPEAFRGLDHPPLRFAVNLSGFAPMQNYLYEAFYEPKIVTPILHFISHEDDKVSPARSMALVSNTVDGEGEGGKRVVRFAGGHVLPLEKQHIDKLTDFVRETCEM